MSEINRMYETAKKDYEDLCAKEKELAVKKSDLEKVISYFEVQFRRRGALEKVDKAPLNDVEVTTPAKRNKFTFMIKICSSFGSKQFSRGDVFNLLKEKYQTFDLQSVPWYLTELTSKGILQYDGLQYRVTMVKQRRTYRRKDTGFNLAGKVKDLVFNGLGEDSLAFEVEKVVGILTSKYPGTVISRRQVSTALWRLEGEGKLNSQPGSHARAAKIFSVVK